jgi:hypothetical protein
MPSVYAVFRMLSSSPMADQVSWQDIEALHSALDALLKEVGYYSCDRKWTTEWFSLMPMQSTIPLLYFSERTRACLGLITFLPPCLFCKSSSHRAQGGCDVEKVVSTHFVYQLVERCRQSDAYRVAVWDVFETVASNGKPSRTAADASDEAVFRDPPSPDLVLGAMVSDPSIDNV